MQAGQYVNQMGTDFYEVLCNEHGIGGEGEYCGDNDAQLGRINLPRGLGRKVRTTRGVLRPRARRGRRFARSPLGELFRPGNLVNHTRGHKWAKGRYRRAEYKFFLPPLQKGWAPILPPRPVV
jgi:tubulin beta